MSKFHTFVSSFSCLISCCYVGVEIDMLCEHVSMRRIVVHPARRDAARGRRGVARHGVARHGVAIVEPF